MCNILKVFAFPPLFFTIYDTIIISITLVIPGDSAFVMTTENFSKIFTKPENQKTKPMKKSRAKIVIAGK